MSKTLSLFFISLKFFSKIPRFEEVRTGSFSTVASSLITSRIGSELRELAIMSKANSTVWDCVKDIRGDFPQEFVDEVKPGKYKYSKGDPFYVTDLERGLVFYQNSLAQGKGVRLKHLRKVRVSLLMVGKKKSSSKSYYTLDDVGLLADVLSDIALGSSRRVNNPPGVEYIIPEAWRTEPFRQGKNTFEDLKRGSDFEFDL